MRRPADSLILPSGISQYGFCDHFLLAELTFGCFLTKRLNSAAVMTGLPKNEPQLATLDGSGNFLVRIATTARRTTAGENLVILCSLKYASTSLYAGGS